MYEDQIKAYRSHYMWTLKPVYVYDSADRPVKFDHYVYICSGCGFEALTHDQRHVHIMDKVENSHLKTVLARANWSDMSYNE